jgi:hypothetical protein
MRPSLRPDQSGSGTNRWRDEMFLIDMDTFSIEQDSIPDGECSGVIKRESGEIELTLANAMHQLDA